MVQTKVESGCQPPFPADGPQHEDGKGEYTNLADCPGAQHRVGRMGWAWQWGVRGAGLRPVLAPPDVVGGGPRLDPPAQGASLCPLTGRLFVLQK